MHTIKVHDHLESKPLSIDQGYRLLGVMRGRGILTPTQSNIAFKEIDAINTDDSHAHHEKRFTGSAAWNACTEALKTGHVGRKIDEYTGLWAGFEDQGYIDAEFSVRS